MGSGKIIGQNQADGWKAWAVGVVGAIICFGLGAMSGMGSNEIFVRPGQDVGYAIGSGLGIGLLVWLAFNFTTLRGQTKGMRALAYFIMVIGGALGVMQNF